MAKITKCVRTIDYTYQELEEELTKLFAEGWKIETSTAATIILTRDKTPQELLD